MMAAVAKGHDSVVTLLLDKKADLNYVNKVSHSRCARHVY